MWCKFGHVTVEISNRSGTWRRRGSSARRSCWASARSLRCPHAINKQVCGESLPHGGVRPFHQKSTCLTQLTLGPYVVQIWPRYGRNFDQTKSAYSTEWSYRLSLICLRRLKSSPGPNVNSAIFQLGRLLMENSRKYASLSGSLS